MTRTKKQQTIQFEGQVSEIELVYKSKVKATDRRQIKGASDSAELFRTGWNPGTLQLQEQFKVMYLNRAYRVLGVYPVSTGGMTGTLADCQLIMTAALLLAAKFILLCHNHPSGSVQPSKADKTITDKIKKAAAVMDIQLLDHLILTEENFFSFASEGLL